MRWSRAALVTVSIALGVAAWVATGLLNQSLEKSIQVAAAPLAGGADFYVSNGELGVPLALADHLKIVRGVQSVRSLIHEQVQVELPGGSKRSALLLGIDLEGQGNEDPASWGIQIEENTISNYVLRSVFARIGLGPIRLGRPPVLVGRELDRALSRNTNMVRVLVDGKIRLVTRAGSVDATGPAASLGGQVLIMDVGAASRLINKPGRATRLDVVAEPNLDLGDLKDRLQQELDQVATSTDGLKTQARVQTPQAQQDRVRDVLAGLEVGFYLCGAGALVVGMFLVYNALAVTVAERSHEIGILRSLGATRDQIRVLFLGEAALLGVLGALIGAPFGVGLGRLLLGPLQKVVTDIFLPLPARDVVISWPNVATGMTAGLITALVAALLPAARAAAQEPADAVRRIPLLVTGIYRILQIGVSTILVLSGVGCILFKGLLPPRIGSYAGIVFLMIAAMFATPVLTALVANLIRPLARRLLGVEGRLAADNLIRAPGRTGLVIAALAASVGLLFQTAGVIRSSETAVLKWLDQTVVADMLLTSGGPISASGQNMPMNLDVGEHVKSVIPGAHVVPISFRNFAWERNGKETTILVIALDAQEYFKVNHERNSPIPTLDLFQKMSEEPGTAIVSDNFALLYKLNVGDMITIPGDTKPLPLRIIGTLEDYSWNRGTVLVHLGHVRDELNLDKADLFHVYLPQGTDPEAERKKLEQSPWAAEHSLFALTRAEMRDHIVRMIRELYGLAYEQLAVVAIVAILGVVSALMISVLQRRRELGLLRAVGATQAQVLRSVLSEAILMGAIGTLIGLLIGIPLQWYVIHVILFEEAGFSFPIQIPWDTAGTITIMAMIGSTLAGLGPALHAARLKITEAIAYE